MGINWGKIGFEFWDISDREREKEKEKGGWDLGFGYVKRREREALGFEFYRGDRERERRCWWVGLGGPDQGRVGIAQ